MKWFQARDIGGFETGTLKGSDKLIRAKVLKKILRHFCHHTSSPLGGNMRPFLRKERCSFFDLPVNLECSVWVEHTVL